MVDTLTRSDDLERRVGRVERHLGFAPAISSAADPRVDHAGVERGVTADSSSASAREWEAIIEPRAREQSPARTRRELLDQLLQRDVAPSPAPSLKPPVAPAPAPAPAPTVAAKLPPPLPPPLPKLPPRAVEA